MLATLKCLIALLPIAWIVMEGPYTRHVLLVITVFLAYETRQIVAARLLRYLDVLVLIGVYLLSSFLIKGEGETYEYKDIFFSTPYALSLGLVIPKWMRRDRRSRSIGDALLAFSVLLTLAGFYALKTLEVDRVVFTRGAELVRGGMTEKKNFLMIFEMSNQVINIIYFTCFSIAQLPLLLVGKKWSTNTVILLGFALAAWCNLLTVTRTVFALAPLVTGLVTLAMYLNDSSVGKLLVKRIGMLALGAIIVSLIDFAGSSTVLLLIERLRDSGDDVRLIIWREALGILAKAPFGHGLEQMTTALWAHNLFLDVGLTSGWGAMLALMLLTALNLAQWSRLVLSGNLNATTTVLLSMTLSLLLIGMIMS